MTDYLLYGRYFLPSGRLDALYSTRLTPTIQASIAAISDPPGGALPEMRGRKADLSNIMVNVQHDVGKWCTEYTWSAEDEMWGIRFLHNFGRLGVPSDIPEDVAARRRMKRVDEEDAVEGGLKGRLSVGAELYFSAKEKSAGGMSLGSDGASTPALIILRMNSVDRHPLQHFTRCHPSFLPGATI